MAGWVAGWQAGAAFPGGMTGGVAHGLQLERADGPPRRWRARCRCGWVGDWVAYQREATVAYRAHREEEPVGHPDVR